MTLARVLVSLAARKRVPSSGKGGCWEAVRGWGTCAADRGKVRAGC